MFQISFSLKTFKLTPSWHGSRGGGITSPKLQKVTNWFRARNVVWNNAQVLTGYCVTSRYMPAQELARVTSVVQVCFITEDTQMEPTVIFRRPKWLLLFWTPRLFLCKVPNIGGHTPSLLAQQLTCDQWIGLRSWL